MTLTITHQDNHPRFDVTAFWNGRRDRRNGIHHYFVHIRVKNLGYVASPIVKASWLLGWCVEDDYIKAERNK